MMIYRLRILFLIFLGAQLSSCNLAPGGSTSGSVGNQSLTVVSKGIHDVGFYTRDIEVNTESIVPVIDESNESSDESSAQDVIEIVLQRLEVDSFVEEVDQGQTVNSNSDEMERAELSEINYVDSFQENFAVPDLTYQEIVEDISPDSVFPDSGVVDDELVEGSLSNSSIAHELDLIDNDSVVTSDTSWIGIALAEQSIDEVHPETVELIELTNSSEPSEIGDSVDTELIVTLESYSPEWIPTEHVNDSVVADIFPIDSQVFFIAEGEAVNSIDLLASYTGIDKEQLEVSEYSQGASGEVIQDQYGLFNYIPTENFIGKDEFTYRAVGGNGMLLEGKVVIWVGSVNPIPVAKIDNVVVPKSIGTDILLLNNDEISDKSTEISLMSTPLNGSVVLTPEGVAHYVPVEGYVGEDSFLYKLTDGDGNFSVANVSIIVECVADCIRAIKLSWEPSISEGVAGYKVYVGSSRSEYTSSMIVGNVTEFNYVVNDRGDYYFAVSAFNEDQYESELSEQVKVSF